MAAGLTKQVTLELFAVAVGAMCAESSVVCHQLEIVTEYDIIYLPIRANILTILTEL